LRAVFFDLDGTLADTVGDIACSMNLALARAGRPGYDVERYRRMIGEGVVVLARRALGHGREALVPDLVEAFRHIYRERLLVETRPYPGVVELLAALREHQVPLAVLSNKPHAATVAVVEGLFGGETFHAIAGEQEGTPKKPDPTTALALSRLLGVPPARCFLVGDSPVDVETAKNAGMAAVGVSWGFRPAEELREAGAGAILDRPGELLALLGCTVAP
jgi:phosphoglycolate phosphatase